MRSSARGPVTTGMGGRGQRGRAGERQVLPWRNTSNRCERERPISPTSQIDACTRPYDMPFRNGHGAEA